MLRNLAAALILALLSHSALGLGLGTLKQSSALNEPFDGRIEILGASARDADTVVVKLADSEQFERAGIRREAVLLALKFAVVDGGSKADYIRITSHEPVREPFLNFLLELNWSNGRVIREYTVLLDPPLYDPKPRMAAPTAPAPAPAMPEKMVTAEPMPMPAPTPAPMTTSPAEPMVAAPPAPPSFDAGSTLGEVQAHDTLWSLANSNRPDGSVSVQQMMLALLRANPEAFGDGNINILRRGAILRMPDDGELHALSRGEALAEVKRQHQLWNDYRGVATNEPADAPLGSDAAMDDGMSADEPMSDDTAMDSEADDGDSRLELVAPTSEDMDAGAGAGADGDADMTLAREELDAQVQENSELQARIDEANEIIDLMRRQVDIKDDELALLQARLQELGIEAPADVSAALEAKAQANASGEMAEIDAASLDGPDGPPEDNEHVVMVPDDSMDDVDITIGDDSSDDLMAASDDDDAMMAGLEDDGDSTVVMGDGGDESDGDGGESFLSGLIPASISSMVPGGAITVLGVLGIVALALLAGLAKLFGGRGDEADHAAAITTVADDDETAVTELASGDDEPITETRDGDMEETVEADAYGDDDVPNELQATSPDLQQTLESTAAELQAPEVPEEDPLEEVNVYLAYERFDQAEELVRKVVAEYPDEHKYKLRLLEVFYSSNDKGAYETAAKELHDAIGEDDPLWESAVAMWAEMSPERALFEEGAQDSVAEDAGEDPASSFVDITADDDDDDTGAKTLSMSPGSDSALESTLVGLAPLADDGEPADEGAGDALDFDLSAETEAPSVADDEIVDLTAADDDVLDLTSAAADDDVLDLTSAAADDDVLDLTGAADDDVLDLTSPVDDDVLDLTSAADDEEVLDLTGGIEDVAEMLDISGEDAAVEDLLDIGGAEPDDDLTAESADLLDITAPDVAGGLDLLDVTKTGDLTGNQSDDDILNVTSPGFATDDEPNIDSDAIADLTDTSTGVDFDISDTVSPAFENEQDLEADSDAMFDITGEETQASSDESDILDFDIGGLDDNDATAEFQPGDSDTFDVTVDEDALAASSMLEESLDLDIPDLTQDSVDTVEMEAVSSTADVLDTVPLENAAADSDPLDDSEGGFDLSLQSAELDELSIGGDTVGGPGDSESDDESEIEFDLALQDTTEMDSLVIDETLELPRTHEGDETLDDLAKSMEESMAELDLGDEEIDLGDETGELDLSLADTTGGLDFDLDDDGDAPSIDFNLDDIDIGELDQDDTVAMDLSGGDTPADQETVAIPVEDTVEVQSDADEADTKLNLAKAYIELGDKDGARSILDEVARDGTQEQQTEAQRLIEQLA